MISGHRRLFASQKIGLDSIPAIIKEMSDDEAIIAMIDSNMHREHILPSERAWSFRKKMEAMSRQGFRRDLLTDESTSGTEFTKLETSNDIRTTNRIGHEAGMSGRQVSKYIRLTWLIPELLELVDKKRITITMGVDISFFDERIQNRLWEYYVLNGAICKKQVEVLNGIRNLNELDENHLNEIMNVTVNNGNVRDLRLPTSKLSKYFPDEMTIVEREQLIYKLLED